MIECRCKTQSSCDPEVNYSSPVGVGMMWAGWRAETLMKAAACLQLVLG